MTGNDFGVHEFLICAEDEDFLLPQQSEVASTIEPPGRHCECIEGWGDYRMTCDGVVTAFSFEAPGIQVIVETEDAHFASELAYDIAAQVAASMGRSTYVVPL